MTFESGSRHHAPCECADGANEFIRLHFCDCLYSVQDGVSFALGLASIAVWLFAQIPQLVENYRNKKAEALSVWFLVDWLMGDCCNLIGCLATGDQLATQVYTAIYFVFADVVVLLQYMYYNALASMARHQARRRAAQRPGQPDLGPYQPLLAADSQAPPTLMRRREEPAGEGGAGSRTLLGVSGLAVVAVVAAAQTGGGGGAGGAEPLHLGRTLQEAAGLAPLGPLMDGSPNWERDFGMFIGYLSSIFYIKGRLSQIIRNCRRRSTEGLSALMFLNAILGNVTYGLAIFLRVKGLQDVLDKLPWIIGSLGTVMLDITILMQELASRVANAKPSAVDGCPHPQQ